MRSIKVYIILFICFCSSSTLLSQPVEQFVKVVVAPDHTDWIYKTGEPVKFMVTVLKDGNPLKNATVRYEIGPERMDPVKKDSLQLKEGKITIDAPGMKTPGLNEMLMYSSPGS